MLARVIGAAVVGVDGLMVQVEVDLAQGLPSFSTVGLAEGAVREAKDRVRAAIRNSGYEFPPRRITVNLAPAAVKKEGTGYDLPIAVGILAAGGLFAHDQLDGTVIAGELSLDGSVRPVPGVLPMALAARQEGMRRLLVPAANVAEAAIVQGLAVYPIERLDQAVAFLAGATVLEPLSIDPAALFARHDHYPVDFSDVRGQEHAKRDIEIAAGRRSPPARRRAGERDQRWPGGCPPSSGPDPGRAIETSSLSTAGLLPEQTPLLVTRPPPLASPHRLGHRPDRRRPIPAAGEVSLAHNGVLFLDELPEFKSTCSGAPPAARGRRRDHRRAATSLRFPARFALVAAMNPVPASYLGDRVRACAAARCRCSATAKSPVRTAARPHRHAPRGAGGAGARPHRPAGG